MKFISHRGNLNGKNPSNENVPTQVLAVIRLGFDCEVDLWIVNDKLYLGHDGADNLIQKEFLLDYSEWLWIHCKNIDAVIWCQDNSNRLHYFWHESDTLTLTSKLVIWAYPGVQPIVNSVAVLPEINGEESLDCCNGICSDFILNYKERYGSL
jgi:hypothetical protein